MGCAEGIGQSTPIGHRGRVFAGRGATERPRERWNGQGVDGCGMLERKRVPFLCNTCIYTCWARPSICLAIPMQPTSSAHVRVLGGEGGGGEVEEVGWFVMFLDYLL